jgi:hypothetical protein
MRKLLALAFSALAISPITAAEVCVSCEEPAAIYRCAVEQPSDKYKLGGTLEQEICTKVLAKKSPHAKCQVLAIPEGGKCEGAPRSVSVTDYQRAISASGESTYEVGAFEIARRNVHDTWTCVTSMFKDC